MYVPHSRPAEYCRCLTFAFAKAEEEKEKEEKKFWLASFSLSLCFLNAVDRKKDWPLNGRE